MQGGQADWVSGWVSGWVSRWVMPAEGERRRESAEAWRDHGVQFGHSEYDGPVT